MSNRRVESGSMKRENGSKYSLDIFGYAYEKATGNMLFHLSDEDYRIAKRLRGTKLDEFIEEKVSKTKET